MKRDVMSESGQIYRHYHTLHGGFLTPITSNNAEITSSIAHFELILMRRIQKEDNMGFLQLPRI